MILNGGHESKLEAHLDVINLRCEDAWCVPQVNFGVLTHLLNIEFVFLFTQVIGCKINIWKIVHYATEKYVPKKSHKFEVVK